MKGCPRLKDLRNVEQRRNQQRKAKHSKGDAKEGRKIGTMQVGVSCFLIDRSFREPANWSAAAPSLCNKEVRNTIKSDDAGKKKNNQKVSKKHHPMVSKCSPNNGTGRGGKIHPPPR